MVYPVNFEQKSGFDKIRAHLKALCLSPMGIKKVDEMAFSIEFSFLKQQLNQTAEFKIICQTEDDFPASFYFDLTAALHHLKIEGTFPEVEEIFNMRRSLETIRAIYNFFKEKGKEKYPNLWDIVHSLNLYPFVIDRINGIVSNNGKIKDNASAQLASIRRDIGSKEQEVSKRIQRIMKQAQAEGWTDDDATLSVREGRLVIPVSAANKRRIKGFIHDESATGKTSYIEPAEVVELNNDLKELEYAERREIVKILTSFADDIRPYIDDLLIAYGFLGEIDFLRAKALFAVEINAVLPVLNDKPIVEWYNAVHPLLYLHLKSEKKQVVPLDIKLDGLQRILVISGPNAGGKSVCLQTVGFLQYMLQTGMLVPLKETSETGIFKNIFIDIGDEQSIENDLSTYSSHLQNMKFFLRNADDKTLFLIDEFGAGTEPMLGGAIAESILETLNQQNSLGVITTHYTNLKHFALSTDGIINGAMLYDSQRLEPLFKLETGEPGSSFAFEIARNIGLPEKILQLATLKVGAGHIDYDRNLKEINRDKQYWKQKREQVKDSGKRLDGIIDKYSADLDEISRLRKEILQKAKVEAQQMLEGANKQIENTIRAIKEGNAEKEKTKLARLELTGLKEQINFNSPAEDDLVARKMEQLRRREERKKDNKIENKPETTGKKEIQTDLFKIEIGNKVKLFGQDTVGEVLDVNGKSVMVAFGSMVTTLHENRLEKISNSEFKRLQKQSGQQAKTGLYNVSERKVNFKRQLDIRGHRADEAMQKVAEFIDEAIMVDVNEVRILHGKGSGILRQLIREYVKTVGLIESFGDESVEFGGAGITVVRFKD
jgi:DNA mismatch repair protein MutS2